MLKIIHSLKQKYKKNDNLTQPTATKELDNSEEEKYKLLYEIGRNTQDIYIDHYRAIDNKVWKYIYFYTIQLSILGILGIWMFEIIREIDSKNAFLYCFNWITIILFLICTIAGIIIIIITLMRVDLIIMGISNEFVSFFEQNYPSKVIYKSIACDYNNAVNSIKQKVKIKANFLKASHIMLLISNICFIMILLLCIYYYFNSHIINRVYF